MHLSYSQVIPTNWQLFTFLCKLKKSLSVTNLSSENNLPTFRLNAPVVIRVKLDHSVETSASYFQLKLVTDNLLFIYVEAN